MPAKEFFKMYSDDIIESTSYWLLESKRKKVEKMLKKYRAVAEAYDIRIKKDEVSKVLISFLTAFNATIVFENQV